MEESMLDTGMKENNTEEESLLQDRNVNKVNGRMEIEKDG